MLFKKEKCLEDEELGFLKAKTLTFATSSIKWKKRIEFLGFGVDVSVSGTLEKLNATERKIIVNALNDTAWLEKQVLEAIQELSLKNNVEFDEWEEYFRCSHIYVDKAELYISIIDMLKHLTYELELKWF